MSSSQHWARSSRVSSSESQPRRKCDLECWPWLSGAGLSSGARGLGLEGAGSSCETWETTELSMEPQPGSHPGSRDSAHLGMTGCWSPAALMGRSDSSFWSRIVMNCLAQYSAPGVSVMAGWKVMITTDLPSSSRPRLFSKLSMSWLRQPWRYLR